MGLAAADVAVEHEVLGPVDEFQLSSCSRPQSAGNEAMLQSYPSRVLLWGNPACLSSRRRLDSARLAFSFSNRLARKPSWPGVASSRAFSSTLCVNGRLRASP